MDVLKCIAIFLVVIGHCVQRSYVGMDASTEAFYSDELFKFIYGFHMPLFMAISGYFFYNTIHKYAYKDIIKSRFMRLVVPIAFWHIIWMITDGFSNQGHGYTILTFLAGFLKQYWFLWAIFYCSIIVLMVETFLKSKRYMVYLVLVIISLLLPNFFNVDRYVFLFPYYLLGFLYCEKYSDFEAKHPHIIMGLGGAILLYLFALGYFDYEDYIYTSGTCVIKDGRFSIDQLYIDLFRLAVGVLGVVSIYGLSLTSKLITIPFWITRIGSKTLGIYIIHMFFTPLISEYPLGVNYFLIVLEAFVLIMVSYFITILLEKNKYLSKCLLGK